MAGTDVEELGKQIAALRAHVQDLEQRLETLELRQGDGDLDD